ncbi:hypothetical protein [Staphylococcus aureus]
MPTTFGGEPFLLHSIKMTIFLLIQTYYD